MGTWPNKSKYGTVFNKGIYANMLYQIYTSLNIACYYTIFQIEYKTLVENI